jgi:hypothetical protein
VIDLVEAGVVNGRRKTLRPGKIVTSFVMGTRRLYDWVHDNPTVELMPSDFTNDPFVIAQNDTMVAINSALAVDLTGQVAADTVGGRFFSGIGGQVDFIRGAARSRDGKPIIALPSTAKGGTVSRIQAVLEAGAGVVTSRGDVDFRSELVAAAKARKYVLPGQRVPRAPPRGEEARSVQVESGAEVTLRLVRTSDEDALQDLFYRVSEESSYERFLGHVSKPSHDELLRWADMDHELSVALVATVPTPAGDEIVALGCYDVDPATRFAEVSLLVMDEWQGRGVGTTVFGDWPRLHGPAVQRDSRATCS